VSCFGITNAELHPSPFPIAPLLKFYKFRFDPGRKTFILTIPDHAVQVRFPITSKPLISIAPEYISVSVKTTVQSCELVDVLSEVQQEDREERKDDSSGSSEPPVAIDVEAVIRKEAAEMRQDTPRYSHARALVEVSPRIRDAAKSIAVTLWGHDDGPIGVLQFAFRGVDLDEELVQQIVSGVYLEMTVLARLN
jgi:hypothetical protein